MSLNKRFRQYIGILAAIMTYYVFHEGAHLIAALYFGVFKQINFLGFGVQIDVLAEHMTDTQLGIFCLVGPVAAILLGWLLILLAKRICKVKSKVFKAVMWYMTLAVLVLDPLYLSVLCDLFGGGDMNGIVLIFPEAVARIAFAIVGVLHSIVILKYLRPEYTNAFATDDCQD